MSTTLDVQQNSDYLVKILNEISNHHSLRIYKNEMGQLKVELESLEQDKHNKELKETEYLDTRATAELIHHSIYWLCRKANRDKNGIKLYRIGGKNLFRKKEILDMIQKNIDKRCGRPRKNIQVENLRCKLVL